MEQSIKRLEDLPGYRIEGAEARYGRIYLWLDGGKHVVFEAAEDIEYDCVVKLGEPDVIELAKLGFITEEQLLYELREEIEGRNWIRVKELADALSSLERYDHTDTG